MMKCMFACVAVLVAGLLADQAQAQVPAQAPAQVQLQAQPPAVIPATGTYSSEIITPAPRTGLFGRLRERRGMTTTVNQPIMQTQAISPQPVPMQQQPSGVQQAQYSEKVAMPATAAMPATIAMPAEMQIVEPRQGLLARLRARRGQ